MVFFLVFRPDFMLFKQAMDQKDGLKFYEQVLVLHPDSSEQEQKEICQLIAGIIEKQKGEVIRVDTWGSRPIANPKAKKASRGWYFYMLFSAPADVISEIRKQLSINNKTLYFHQESLPKKESPENHIQKFIQNLEQTTQREKERIARNQKRHNWTNRA